MVKKHTYIVLQAGNIQKPFNVQHAERLLNMPKNGGWHIPEDSPFKQNQDGVIVRRNKGTAKEAEE